MAENEEIPALNQEDVAEQDVNLRKENKDLPSRLTNPKDYPVWALRMKLHFTSISVWEVVEGTHQQPPAEAALDLRNRYKKDSSRAHSDLLRCLGQQYQQLAATYNTVTELWQALETLFRPATNTQLLAVQKQLEALTYKEPLTELLLTIQQLTRELEQLGGTMSSGQKAAKLLALLPATYDEFSLQIQTDDAYKVRVMVNNVEQLTKELDFTKIFEQVYRRATLREVLEKSNPTQTSVLYTAKPEKNFRNWKTNNRNSMPRNRQGDLTCFNCGERGHTAAKCDKCALCSKSTHATFQCPHLPKARDLADSAPQQSRSSPKKRESSGASDAQQLGQQTTLMCRTPEIPSTPIHKPQSAECCFVTIHESTASEPQNSGSGYGPIGSGRPSDRRINPPRYTREERVESDAGRSDFSSDQSRNCVESSWRKNRAGMGVRRASQIISVRDLCRESNRTEKVPSRSVQCAAVTGSKSVGQSRESDPKTDKSSSDLGVRKADLYRKPPADQVTRTPETPLSEASRSTSSWGELRLRSPEAGPGYFPFVIDSASSVSLCAEPTLMQDLVPLPATAQIVTCGATFHATHVGALETITKTGLRVKLANVYHSRKLSVNVLSLSMLKASYDVVLGSRKGLIEARPAPFHALMDVRNGVYVLDLRAYKYFYKDHQRREAGSDAFKSCSRLRRDVKTQNCLKCDSSTHRVCCATVLGSSNSSTSSSSTDSVEMESSSVCPEETKRAVTYIQTSKDNSEEINKKFEKLDNYDFGIKITKIMPRPQAQILFNGEIVGMPLSFNSCFSYNLIPEKWMSAAFSLVWTEHQDQLPFCSSYSGKLAVVLNGTHRVVVRVIFVKDPALRELGLQVGESLMKALNVHPQQLMEHQLNTGAYNARVVKFMPRTADWALILGQVDELDEEFVYSDDSSDAGMSMDQADAMDRVLESMRARHMITMPRLRLPEVAVNQAEIADHQLAIHPRSPQDGSGVDAGRTSRPRYWLRSSDSIQRGPKRTKN